METSAIRLCAFAFFAMILSASHSTPHPRIFFHYLLTGMSIFGILFYSSELMTFRSHHLDKQLQTFSTLLNSNLPPSSILKEYIRLESHYPNRYMISLEMARHCLNNPTIPEFYKLGLNACEKSHLLAPGHQKILLVKAQLLEQQGLFREAAVLYKQLAYAQNDRNWNPFFVLNQEELQFVKRKDQYYLHIQGS